MTHVAMYAHQAFYLPILQPIYDVLCGKAECLLTGNRREVVAFRPNVVVMASHTPLGYFRERLPGAVFVNIRHGLINKLAGSGSLAHRKSTYVFDAICIGARSAVDPFRRAGMEPAEFWWTGYPQMDPLFRGDPPPDLPLDTAGKTVLYAPTWNPGLSSAPVIGPQLVDRIREGVPGVNIIIKPHPVIRERQPRWITWWRHMAKKESGVYLVEDLDANLMPYMLYSDLLISDASSAIFEFLALDRPIVLMTNPQHRWDPAYDCRDIVWRWRDVGDEIHDPAELPGAVAEAINNPEKYGECRRRYADMLFGSMTDGCNHVRVAEKVLAAGKKVAKFGARRNTGRDGERNLAGWFWTGLRARLGTSTILRKLRFGPWGTANLWLRERIVCARPFSD
ncbi:MAG: CDP-glycerol glycerophosphotransferase family protein [Gammaproteobacteria bacterium]